MRCRARTSRSRGAAWAAVTGATLACAALLDGTSWAAPSALAVLRSGASDQGFERAESVRKFAFPQDYGPHGAFRHEWWYFTGHLRATDGERFGFELTFFRVAFAPPRPAALAASAGEALSHWRARQMYVAHFAITDIEQRAFHSTQRVARDALGLSGARADPFRVWLGGWSVAGDAGDWVLRAGDCAYGLDVQLHALGPPVLNGDRGLSIKSAEPGAASYYFSVPRIAVKGHLVRRACAAGATRPGAAQALDVAGDAWLDREWGSGSLGPRQVGWDWFALQLEDGSSLMFYALRDAGGRRDAHSAGTWVDRRGAVHALTSPDVQIEVLDYWSSPQGTRYPSRWRLRIKSLGLEVTAVPVLANQELETTPRYWEGDVDVAGTLNGKATAGEGYVELVGYAQR